MGTTETIDVVTPLYLPDLERFKNLRRTMKRFWNLSGKHFVIVPHEEVGEISRELAGDSVTIVDENEIVSEEARRLPGWKEQQVRKIAASKLVESDFYLMLDSDTIVLRNLRLDELVKAGKGYAKLVPFNEQNEAWYDYVSTNILMEPRPPMAFYASSFVFSREISNSLQKRVEEIWSKPWQTVLAERSKWTETSLYFSHAWTSKLFDSHHFSSNDHISIWSIKDKGKWSDWNPDKIFRSGKAFCVVPSRTEIGAGEIWDKIRHFVDK